MTDECVNCKIRRLEDELSAVVQIAKDLRVLYRELINPLLRQVEADIKELGFTDETNDVVIEQIRQIRSRWLEIPEINGGG